MKSTRNLSVMKRLLFGTLGFLALGLLAACGSYTTTQSQNALSQSTVLHAPHVSYPDPTNQDALPASVKVTGKDETVLLRASVTQGYQIYECQPSSADASGFAWKLQAPFALLKTDAGANLIHATGPTWLYTQDESEVSATIGKFTTANGGVVPATATPDPKSVPWLRLDVTNHLGNAGLLSNVDQIQRLYTHAGKAPSSGCNQDAANHHVIQQVSYTAEYVFWGHKG